MCVCSSCQEYVVSFLVIDTVCDFSSLCRWPAFSALHLSLLLPLQLTCSEASPASLEGRALCLIWPSSCPVTDFFFFFFSIARCLHWAHRLLPLGTGFPCLFFGAEPNTANKFLPHPWCNINKTSFFLIMIFLSHFAIFPQSWCAVACPHISAKPVWKSSGQGGFLHGEFVLMFYFARPL